VGDGLARVERQANGIEDSADEVHAKYKAKKDEKKNKLIEDLLKDGQ